MKHFHYPLLIALLFLTLPAFSQKKKAAPKPTIAHADSLFVAGGYKEAVVAYEAALKDPAASKDARAWLRLGASHYNLKDYNKAITAYVNAEKINPGLPGLRVNLARAYSSVNDINKALVTLDSAMAGGFANYKLMDTDPGFENLRKDSRYNDLRERAMNYAYPCRTLPEARQFDFWLGEWDVHPTANMSVLAGYNKITRAAEGCLIVENWTSAGPHAGMSLNYYDPTTGKWNQKWVGSGQDITEFTDGVYADGMMRFKFTGRNPDGTTFQGRLTFTNMDGKVRQHSERTSDNGNTWQTIYDFTYIRKAAGEMP
jgi:hypothetical protein